MKLEEAFKQSSAQIAKREENGSYIFIQTLSETQGFILQRWLLRNTGYVQQFQKIYPHLGSLLNAARQQGYLEVKRYANDWQPAHHLGIETQLIPFPTQEQSEEDDFKWVNEWVEREMDVYQRYMEGDEEAPSVPELQRYSGLDVLDAEDTLSFDYIQALGFDIEDKYQALFRVLSS